MSLSAWSQTGSHVPGIGTGTGVSVSLTCLETTVASPPVEGARPGPRDTVTLHDGGNAATCERRHSLRTG